MKNFKLYAYIGNMKVLVTNSQELSHASTFDESCSIEENQLINFQCKIAKYMHDLNEENKYYNLFYPEAPLTLELLDYDGNIESSNNLIIKECSPEFYKENEILAITAKDYASDRFSKRGANLNFNETGNIQELAMELFAQTNVNPKYTNAAKNWFSPYKITETTNCEWTDGGLKYITNENNSFQFKIDIKDALPEAVYDFNFYPFLSTVATDDKTIDIIITTVEKQGQKLISDTFHCLYNRMFSYGIQNTSNLSYIQVDCAINNVAESDILLLKEMSIKLSYNVMGLVEDLWQLDPNILINTFKNNTLNDTTTPNIYARATLELSGSNFYNGLIELCSIFDAEVQFNYERKIISFIPKSSYQYKGIHLSPDFNIKSFTRNASSEQLYTVIDVYGGENEDKQVTLLPDMPIAFKNYFWECVNHNFINDDERDYFENYQTDKYKELLKNEIKPHMNENEYLQQEETLQKYVTILDRVPNFENRIYDISYFWNTKKITKAQYEQFLNLVQNELRKKNIAIYLYSEQYYDLLTQLSKLESEIDFLTRNIVTEQKYQNELNKEMEKYEEDSRMIWAVRNRLANSQAAMERYWSDLYKVYGTTGSVLIKDDSLNYDRTAYFYNILHLYGYQNNLVNGFRMKLKEVQDAITELTQKYTINAARLVEIQEELDNDPTEYQKQQLLVEQAGLNRYQETIEAAIGRDSQESYDAHSGYLLIRENIINTLLTLYEYDKNEVVGYADYLDNYNSEYNLIRKRDEILKEIWTNYNQFLIEGYYENTDELDSFDLAEQAFIAIENMLYPKITFDIGVIDLSSLENYKFLKIKVGDKIKIQDDNLFLQYNPKLEQYLTINGIDYNLRDPSATKLKINKEDADNRIIQKLFISSLLKK